MKPAAPPSDAGGAALDPTAIDLPPGVAWCGAWSDRVDQALSAWSSAGEQRGLAVVALGGYARRELCPASDIDLLLLHSGWEGAGLSELVQRLCYPLWDAGLQVGHAVRTPAQAVAAARERVDTATALTDRRLVAGESGLLDDLASRASRWLRRNAAVLFTDLAAATAARHRRAGDRPGLLEPHLKDGAGGLRDLHGLRWAAACLLGEVGLDPLVDARYLGAAARRELADAGRTLLEARCALHLVLGRSARPGAAELDRLRLDLSDEVAARLGLADGDELLRGVALAMRTIAYTCQRVWPQLVEDARGERRRLRGGFLRGRAREESLGEGLTLRDGTVAVAADRSLATEPSLALRAVAAAGRLGLWLDRTSAERLRREVAEAGTLPWDEPARAALLDLLRAGHGALPALADADFLGLLVAYLPGWAKLRGRPQRNPFHRYDLDTHLALSVAELVDLRRGGLTERETVVFEGLDDPDTLLLGAFLHDIGKAWPGDHSVVGAEIAPGWVRSMGFGEDRAERVGRLVRHHLLLPDAATRRDLEDPEELAEVAREVVDRETLDGLYLLSLADARATGPTVYSPWKDGLIGELHARVRRLLADGDAVVVPGPAEVVAAVRAGADGAVESFLDGADARYLMTAGAAQVRVHAGLATPPPAVGELRADTRPGPVDGTVKLSVAAGDRRGLMADCAGVLAAAGADVLDARAFTSAAGTALSWFVVRPVDLDWERVTTDLARAAAGDLDVAAAVTARESRRGAPRRPSAAAVPPAVSFDIRHWQAAASRVEIAAPDAPGLLYRLATVLADAGLDVIGARVTTLTPEVRDVFFFRGPLPPAEVPALAAALERAATPR